ncbi:MAG TPA: GntR family transcriptional regulator [Solirubrobacterales bacterium]|jgi:DNA-binding GntR family transcriptional regulator
MSNGDRGRTASDGLLVDSLAVEIQRRIMEGAVPVGSWLRQEALAKEFGVSRTPVREALQKLEAIGIVELVPYRGALTRGPTARQIRETYEVRAQLEGLAAELAAERIRPDQLERLRAAAALFSESVEEAPPSNPQRAGRELPWQRANTMLHEIVQEAAGNERLSAAITDLHRSFPRNLTWAALCENPRLLKENVAEHERVVEAIERNDPRAARRAMVRHVKRAGAIVSDWFERQSQARG